MLGQARALVVNAGNSNAFTGSRGRSAVEAIAARVAGHLGCQPSDVFVAPTGVIGVALPIPKAEAGLDTAFVSDPFVCVIICAFCPDEITCWIAVRASASGEEDC